MKSGFTMLLVLASSLCGEADTLTLSVAVPNATQISTNFVVPTNVVAQFLYTYCSPGLNGGSTALKVTIGNATAYYFPVSTGTQMATFQALPVVVGPATITLTATNPTPTIPVTYLAYCTIQTTSATSFNPSTAVVIPNDGGGPVTIVLESSVDLVTWTPALPGTYGTTTSNRFFRVRAQR